MYLKNKIFFNYTFYNKKLILLFVPSVVIKLVSIVKICTKKDCMRDNDSLCGVFMNYLNHLQGE